MTDLINLQSAWVEVSNGATLLEVDRGAALIHIGTVAPAANSQAYHRLGGDWPRSLVYSGTQKIYARAGVSGASLIVTKVI